MSKPTPGLVLAAALVPLVAALDIWTGDEISLAPFYLLAVIAGTWRGGRAVGFALAAVSAISGLLADLLMSEPYLHFANSFSSAWIPYWNALARLSVYTVAVLVGSKLQHTLALREKLVRELQQALGEIRTLQGLLPVCAWCKRIRDEEDGGAWKPIERYVAEHTHASFTHGICPACAREQMRNVDGR